MEISRVSCTNWTPQEPRIVQIKSFHWTRKGAVVCAQLRKYMCASVIELDSHKIPNNGHNAGLIIRTKTSCVLACARV